QLMGSKKSDNWRRLERHDSVDSLSEEVHDLASRTPSTIAYRLGKFMLKEGVPDFGVKIALDKIDSVYYPNGIHKTRAAQLVRQWVRYSDYTSKGSLVRSRLQTLVENIDGIVINYEVFDAMMALIKERRDVPVLALEDDISDLGKEAHIFGDLPYRLQMTFFGKLGAAVEFNRKRPWDQRRRFNHLGELVASFAPFATKRHNLDLYDVIDRIAERDKRNILHPLHHAIANLPESLPGNAAAAIYKASEFLPEDSVMLDEEVREFDEFVTSITRAFEFHEPYEIECFFDLYRRRIKYTESWNTFKDLRYMLDASYLFRQVDGKEPLALDDEEMEKLRYLGSKYLQVSLDIAGDSDDECRSFADRIVTVNRHNLKEAAELIQLYELVMIDQEHIGDESSARLSRLIQTADEDEMLLQDIERNRNAILEKGPIPCPPYLKDHLQTVFEDILDEEVTELWDLRSSHRYLYMGRGPARTFIELTRLKTNPPFIGQSVRRLIDTGVLEDKIHQIGAGCGPATAEIEYYNQLVAAGYDVELTLVDKSPDMIEEAERNCIQAGIEATFLNKRIEDINLEDIACNRQVHISYFGSTFGNFEDPLGLVADHYRLFEALYLLELRAEGGLRPGWKSPLLLIDGEIEKNPWDYGNRLARLFLARGLGSGYQLRMDALMHEGKLCHTSCYEPGDSALQALYLVTKNCGPFRKNQAIWVIDSNTMHPDIFTSNMKYCGFTCDFVSGPGARIASICRPVIRPTDNPRDDDEGES
ncbi:class I SAM-dependent methyltransferase, partial [Nanoarchaeota archaeon]